MKWIRIRPNAVDPKRCLKSHFNALNGSFILRLFRSSYPMYNNSVLPPVIQPAAVPAYHAALHHAAGLPHPAGNGLPLHPHHPGLHHPATAAGGPPPAALHPPGSGGHKKPIPLPRSKIPLPTPKSATVDRLGESTESQTLILTWLSFCKESHNQKIANCVFLFFFD